MRFRAVKLFLFLVIIITSCNNIGKSDSDAVLVRVYDEYLYASDLEDIVPAKTSARDSLIITKNYINNWIHKLLMVYQAEKNLPEDQQNFEKQLEDYRTSLIIYHYESLLINQQLDTTIYDEEIQDYYAKNKKNFELKDNIVKVNYVIANQADPNIDKYKDLLLSIEIDDRDTLLYYCESYAEDFILDSTRWIFFNDLLNIIPIKTYNYEIYLRNNRFVELKDQPYQYFINFIDFTVKDSISPLSFVRDNIKSIIRNKRKIELINQMQKEVFNNALNENNIEIF